MKKRASAGLLACATFAAALLLPASCSSRRYSVEQFKRLVKGKTEQEVIAAVGKPQRIMSREQTENRTYWYYVYRTYDPATGQAQPQTEVIFRDGRVIQVNLE